MKFEPRTEEEICRSIRSAGQSFLGLRMEELISRINELEDKEAKKKLIEEFYENQVGTYDRKVSGTRTRVYSAIRIIAADQVIFALEKIDGSNPRVLPEALDKAKETLAKIKNGKIKLPVLD